MRQSILCALIVALALLFFISSEVPAQESTPRFELGGQFSSLSRNKPTSQYAAFYRRETEPDPDFFRHDTEPGVGGRFTFNVTSNIAFEAEVNLFPQQKESAGIFFAVGQNQDTGVPGGRIYQGQFGIKAGKRFKKVGVFGKVRPGFVSFTEVSRVASVRTVIFETRLGEAHVRLADFELGKETYSSTDVGGVIEFYPSRRIVMRFDIGDTIIRYGVYRERLVRVCAGSYADPFCGLEVFERPAETRHNLQSSAGVGIRF